MTHQPVLIRRMLAVVALATTLVAAGSAHAAPVADACPKVLNVKQTVVDTVQGWTAGNQQADYPFARLSFYQGEPAQETRLVPTYELRNASGLHDGWKLSPQPAGYWVSCQYGGTTATVNRKLDADINFCQADYDSRFSALVVKHWSCGDLKSYRPKPAVKPAAKAPPRPVAHPASTPH